MRERTGLIRTIRARGWHWLVPHALCAALAAFLIAGAAAAQDKSIPESEAQIELSFAPLVKKTAPAVVNINTRTVVKRQISPLLDDPFFRRFFGEEFPGLSRERVERSLGSGTIVDASGIIITNHHVIRNADQITVALADRREFEAEVVRSDERTDLAILKIDTGGEKVPYLEFGDPDALEVGDLVLAIGDPFNVGQTVTSGIVSALARTKVGISDFHSFIQTDAAINPGNSGGPLINMKGEVVGINTAIFSRSGGSHGVGFAIPASMAKAVLRAALTGAPAAHPWLGVSGQSVTSDIAEAIGMRKPQGVLVKAIHPLSPARAAGLKEGDIVRAVNGRETNEAPALNFEVATHAVGESVTLDILREGEAQQIAVELVAPPETPPRNVTQITADTPMQGATVANLSPAVADEIGVDDMLAGVVILEVEPRSIAARMEFQPGDVVLEVNGVPTETVAALQQEINKFQRAFEFTVSRGGRLAKFTVRR